MVVFRVFPRQPVVEFDAYRDAGGGQGLLAARKLGAAAVLDDLTASGLRGRGGAGFPTGVKWRAVRERRAATPTTVVVNAAEGEPGSFKDRAILRANPFAVLEGALIAALTVDADRIIVATRASFTRDIAIVERAVDELRHEGWIDGVTVDVFAGPEEYLVGEETGLLEVLDGRPPFPRIAPPFRHGVDEVFVVHHGEPAEAVMATPEHETDAPPTLVNNVETMANVAAAVARGPAWFREYGTDESPGTIVCTVGGDTQRSGVGEFPMGTPLQVIIDELGGGPRPGRGIAAVMSGVANALVAPGALDTPATYEDMHAIGSGLGCAGFIVFDDACDFAAVAHGVARFLAVESCGQCTPCKQDGLAIEARLDRIRRSDAHGLDLLEVDERLRTVADSARCSLARQQQTVVGSIREMYEDMLLGHIEGREPAADTVLIAPIVDIDDGIAVLDERHRRKQPDWGYGPVDSGEAPADRFGQGRPDRYPTEPASAGR